MGSNLGKNKSLQRTISGISEENERDLSSESLGNAPQEETMFDKDDLNVVYTDFIGKRTGVITDEYILINPPIGKGSFGEVRKAVHKKTNIIRAVKIIYKSFENEAEHKAMINEINVLKRLDHPNIMKIFEFYEDEKNLYLITEYYDGGQLFDKIISKKTFSERQAAHVMKQILSAVSYCHANKIVHRDLKPENILFESNEPNALLKIVDFGTSRFYDPQSYMHQRFGTPYYMAPEVLRRKYTEKCDVWSCGVILYTLLCGYPPFNGHTEKEIMKNVSTGIYTMPPLEWDLVSDSAINLVKRMLEFDPNKRCSAEEALNDPWFKLVLEEPTFDVPLAVSVLNNLLQFRAERKLQNAMWMFLVTYLVSNEEKSKLLQVFQALDLNGDGRLSREELLKGFEKILGSSNPETIVDEIMEHVDNNRSGCIDYTEFVIACINKDTMLSKEKLDTTFRLFDKDGDGYLTAQELAQKFNPGNCRTIDEKVWYELLNEFDQNGDGKLSLKEFKQMMGKFS